MYTSVIYKMVYLEDLKKENFTEEKENKFTFNQTTITISIFTFLFSQS